MFLGGCKHATAFLAWLHRRSHDRPSTSVDCYWKKSKLSSVGTSLKFKKIKDLGKVPKQNIVRTPPVVHGDFLRVLTNHSKMVGNTHNQIMKYFVESTNFEKLSIHYFTSTTKETNADNFIEHCRRGMATMSCKEAAIATIEQNDCPLWHELRYARITASKAYEAAHCTTFDGSLTESIMGATKLKDTKAMARGRILEKQIIMEVSKLKNIKIKRCGLYLHPNYPIMGASPDGENEMFSIEIKCPASQAALSRYITAENKVAPKFLAQVQLQMHFSNKTKALFCVADSDFETNRKVSIIEVEHDERFCKDLLEKCISFWTKAIFPKLQFL